MGDVGVSSEIVLCVPAGSAALQRMISAWQDAPVAGTLSQKVEPNLMASDP